MTTQPTPQTEQLTLSQDEIRVLKTFARLLAHMMRMAAAPQGAPASQPPPARAQRAASQPPPPKAPPPPRPPPAVQAPQAPVQDGLPVATDQELDGRYGDPVVKQDPRDWAGPSYLGARYSQCPSDYLRLVAEQQQYYAKKGKADPEPRKDGKGRPYWQWNETNAKLARGWLRRNHGKVLAPPATQAGPAAAVAPSFDGRGQQAVSDEEAWFSR